MKSETPLTLSNDIIFQGLVDTIAAIVLLRALVQFADHIEDIIANDKPWCTPIIDTLALSTDDETKRLTKLFLNHDSHPEIDALQLRAERGKEWRTYFLESEASFNGLPPTS